MIPLLDKHNTIMPPSSTVNLTQLKFESAKSSDSESNMVWIILFSLLIFISVLSNSFYIIINIKRRCLTHTLLSVFFLLNLLDYVLLIIEFSSDDSGQFSHSETWCSLYQLLLQTSPLLTALTVVVLIYQAWGLRSLSTTPAILTISLSSPPASVVNIDAATVVAQIHAMSSLLVRFIPNYLHFEMDIN